MEKRPKFSKGPPRRTPRRARSQTADVFRQMASKLFQKKIASVFAQNAGLDVKFVESRMEQLLDIWDRFEDRIKKFSKDIPREGLIVIAIIVVAIVAMVVSGNEPESMKNSRNYLMNLLRAPTPASAPAAPAPVEIAAESASTRASTDLDTKLSTSVSSGSDEKLSTKVSSGPEVSSGQRVWESPREVKSRPWDEPDVIRDDSAELWKRTEADVPLPEGSGNISLPEGSGNISKSFITRAWEGFKNKLPGSRKMKQRDALRLYQARRFR